jgi:hypothetical protein
MIGFNKTSTVYRVEARSKQGTPIKFGDQIFGIDWIAVQYVISPIGVSAKDDLDNNIPSSQGYFRYGVAKTLQLWFLSETGITALETRITSHKFTMSYNFHQDGYEKAIDWTCVNFEKMDK